MKTKSMILVSLFASITAIFAFLPAIPLSFSPVPITFQLLGVFLAGAILGGRLGALSQLVYLLIGIIGIPVFSGGSAGISVLFGPTGGYLIGFPIAAYLIGLLVKKSESKPNKINLYTLLAIILPILIIYVPGTLQLSFILKMPLQKAFVIGSLPYIPLDIVKCVLALVIAFPTRKRLKQSLPN